MLRPLWWFDDTSWFDMTCCRIIAWCWIVTRYRIMTWCRITTWCWIMIEQLERIMYSGIKFKLIHLTWWLDLCLNFFPAMTETRRLWLLSYKLLGDYYSSLDWSLKYLLLQLFCTFISAQSPTAFHPPSLSLLSPRSLFLFWLFCLLDISITRRLSIYVHVVLSVQI